MKTKLVKLNQEHLDAEVIKEAGAIIKNGGLVAFPTETVYGLGGDALNRDSSQKIYAAKGRPSDNPLIVHIADIASLESITEFVPECTYRLAEAFWPGPLTIILKKSDKVPPETTGGLDTVAIRMPGHEAALRLIKEAGGYIAAPSANTSGRPSPTCAKYVAEDMNGRIEMILDGGTVDIGLESTILDVTGAIPTILRPGYVTKDMLQKVLGTVEMDKTIFLADCGQAPKAPGMKYKHYAPAGELTIVSGEQEAVVKRINVLTLEQKEKGEKVGVIATEETEVEYHGSVIKSVGRRSDEKEIARRLYTILREFDEEGVTVIYSESFSGSEMGQAIMNRLLKAAGHHVIECAGNIFEE